MVGADLSQFLFVLSVAQYVLPAPVSLRGALRFVSLNAGYRDSDEGRVCCFDLLSLVFYSSPYILDTC